MSKLTGRHYQDVVINDILFVIRPVTTEETMLEIGMTPQLISKARAASDNNELDADMIRVGLNLRQQIICRGVVGYREADGSLVRTKLVNRAAMNPGEDDLSDLSEAEITALYDAISAASGMVKSETIERFPVNPMGGTIAHPGETIRVPTAPD